MKATSAKLGILESGAGLRIDRQLASWLILGLGLVLVIAKPALPEQLIRPAEWMIWPFADWINTAFDFGRDELGLFEVTRAFSAVVEWLLDVSANLLYGKNRWPRVGPIPWTMVAATAGVIGWALGGWRLSLLAVGTFVWVAVIGQWKLAMQTLSVILVAAPIAVLFGLILGVGVWRSRTFERILNPILNVAQSLPHFAYMIPVVVFIGVGPKAGAVVTVIFAVPPMIRMTALGLKLVASEIVDSGRMCGSTKWQLLRHVQLPTARHEVLVGVNQVIMQCLAMVVLASFIGMPGLGQKLLNLLQGLKIGRSIEIGITIVLIGIVLDRCSRAWVSRTPTHYERGVSWYKRNKLLVLWFGLMVCFLVAAEFFPILDQVKRRSAMSVAKPLDAMTDSLIGILDPITNWLRWFLITWILIPMRDLFLWLPFSAVLVALAGIGWRIGGLRSAVVCVAFILPIAMSGWWDRAMITVYMVTSAVLIASLLGFPLGIWAAQRESRSKRMLLVCDTLQTFPSFIYLIPVVMLFGVNDVAAIGAVLLYASVPLIRYTVVGLRGVPESMIEAAEMSGASTTQSLWQVRMPIALPTIMVGINQSVMFSLFMVIIAAFIGTQDLGQEMQRALSFTDVGKGLVLGLAVAFMGLTIDHLALTWSAARKKILGLV